MHTKRLGRERARTERSRSSKEPFVPPVPGMNSEPTQRGMRRMMMEMFEFRAESGERLGTG